jgi:5-formyltetrahydrofolate cyclo-ligase
MSGAAGELKAALRRQLRAAARQHASGERAAAATCLRARLQRQPLWRHARAVLFFAPLPDEPDVWPLVHDALRGGKVVALPRHCAAGDHYLACVIRSARRDLRPGRFGVPEPRADCPVIPLNRLDFVLVPGIGFSLDGARLGRGRGYYDRLLAQVPGWKCGVAFDWQVTPALPVEPHDVRLNCLLTPTRWLVV